VTDVTEKPTILNAGSTGSIGNAAAVALATRGAAIVLMGRRAEKLNTRAVRIRSVLADAGVDRQPDDVATLVVDFSDMDSVRAAADEALRRFGRSTGWCCRSARSFREVTMCRRTGTR
jgi:NAD(P)-dependent dehydrogenase (short-subunit alcohol dehydrogenase family)